MVLKKLKDLIKGDLFQVSQSDNATLYMKGDYDRGSKTFSVHKVEDVNDERFMKANKMVYVD